MAYSKHYNCIFVHQRKAGGSTIKTLFPDATGEFNDGILTKNNRWLTDPRVETAFKFTVVRNPWDRFISGWRYCKSTQHRQIADVLRYLPHENLIYNIASKSSWTSKQAYAKEYLSRTSSHLRFRFKRQLGLYTPIWIPDQGHDYRHITRQQLPTILNASHDLVIDKIFYLEDLESCLTYLRMHLGVDTSKLRLQNTSKKGHDYRLYFDDKLRSIFSKKFPLDTELLGYRFEDGAGVPPANCLHQLP